MKVKNVFGLLLLGTAMLLPACQKDPDTNVKPAAEDPYPGINLPDQLRPAVDIERDFAVRLFKELPVTSGNVCVSPISAYASAYALLRGTTGVTNQKLKTLVTGDRLEYGNIQTFINDIRYSFGDRDRHVSLLMSEGIFYAPELQPENSVEGVLGGYGCVMMDKSPAGTTGMSAINSWVAEKTANSVNALLSKPLDDGTLVTIADAVYFKGSWQEPFPQNKNYSGPFTTIQGEKSDKLFMKNPRLETTNYYAAEGWSMVPLYYGNRSNAMKLYIPDKGEDFNTLVEKLDIATLRKIEDNRRSAEIEIKLPRFSNDVVMDLLPAIAKVAGISENVALDAMFVTGSGATAPELGSILQRGKIGIEIGGTDAEPDAVTVAAQDTGKPTEKVVFNFDRPFIYTIEETSTGTILFMGSVVK